MTEQKIAVCRLCWAAHENLNFINNIQTDMLQIVFPKMDVNMLLFAMICNACAKTLNQIFTFKSSVLEIDNNLHNYTNNGQRKVNLEDILEGQDIEEMCENKIKTRRVCRTCLEHLKDNLFTELSESNYGQQMVLQTCLPEMNIQMTKHPVVCPKCVNTLETMFNFVRLCMENENKIKYYQKTLSVDSRKSQNGVKVDIIGSGNVIVVSDDESSAKKYNTRESNLKIANMKRNEDGTDEIDVDDDVADPDYEIDKDSCEYDSDFDDEQIKKMQDMRPRKRQNGVKVDIVKSGDFVVSDAESSTKQHKTTENNSKIVNTKRIKDGTDEMDEGLDYEMDKDSSEYDSDLDEGEIQKARVEKGKKKRQLNECSVSKKNVHGSLAKRYSHPITSSRESFIYCEYCSFKTLDEKSLKLHQLHCQINPSSWETILRRAKVQMKRRNVLKEVHVNLTGEKDIIITDNTSTELQAKRAEIIEPIQEVEDIELVTSIEENSVTLRVRRSPVTYAKEIEEERENNKSLVPRERDDLVISNILDTYMTNQSPTPGDFVEVMILRCQLCGFNTRSLSKIKDHLASHSFDGYFMQYNIAGYKEIFCCSKCIRSFHDKVSLQDHECVNNYKVNVPQFKLGVVSYCTHCFFETEEEDVFLSHIKQCTDQ